MIGLKMTLGISSSLLCLGLALAPAARAAESGTMSSEVDEATSEVEEASNSGAPDQSSIADIVVTAQRRSESLQRTPVAVSVISAESLARKAITSEGDLQASVPGLTVRTGVSSNSLNYSIRGQSIDTFSFSPPAVLPYVNEVQASAGSSSAFYDLQSVQVLKGPQGTLFGRNATGGAVLFTTAKPTNTFEGYVIGRLGDYEQRYLEGAINVPLVDDAVLLRVSGALQHRKGFQTETFDGRNLGTIERESIRGSLTIMPAAGIRNELVVDYQHSGGSNTVPVVYNVYPQFTNNAAIPANVLFSSFLDVITQFPGAFASYIAANPRADPNGIIAFADKQRARGPYIVSIDKFPLHRAHNLIVTNITTFDIGDNTQFKNVFGYSTGKTNDFTDNDGTPFLVSNNDTYRSESTFISEEPQILGKLFDGKLSYIVGAYFARQILDTFTNNIVVGVAPIIPQTVQTIAFRNRSTSIAGYAQATYDLSSLTGLEGLGVTAGIRYTSEKVESIQFPTADFYNLNQTFPTAQNELSNTFKKPSWTIGVQEQVNPNLLLYAVTRRSFRSGGFNGSSAPFPGTADTGGAAFKPEIATDVELGAKFQGKLGDVPTRLSIAAYSMWVKDNQRAVFAQVPQTGSVGGLNVNVPKSRIRGIEADAQIKPAQWLTFGGSLAYTDAKYIENQVVLFGVSSLFGPYPDTPEWSGTFYTEASAPLPNELGTITARADVYAQNRFFFGSSNNTTGPGTEIPGYALVNFRVGLENIQKSGLSISGTVKNAFDRTYYTGGFPTGSILTLNSVGPGDRRTIFAEVRYKW